MTGDNPFCCAGEAGEALLFKALEREQLGPKLHGVYPGWRLEEYVPSRMLNFQDLRDEKMLKLLAGNLARIHSLDVELPKNPLVFENVLRESIEKGDEMKQGIKYVNFSELTQVRLRLLMAIDYKAEIELIFEAIRKIPNRVVCSHNDFYANNILVRTKKDHSELQELTSKDILTVDLEMVSYFYRGNDIGLLLYYAALDLSDAKNAKFVGQLDESYERAFIKAYLEVWKGLNPSKYDAAIDNEENVMKEQRVLQMLRMAYLPLWIVGKVVSGEWEESVLETLIERMNCDAERKALF